MQDDEMHSSMPVVQMTEAYFEKIQEEIYKKGKEAGYAEGIIEGKMKGASNLVYYLSAIANGHMGEESLPNDIVLDECQDMLRNVLIRIKVRRRKK